MPSISHIFRIFGLSETKEEVIHKLLIQNKKTISTAESCTSGLLSKLLTSLPGSSAYFLGGIISYHNQVKLEILKVPDEYLKEYGAVSFEVAGYMAKSARDIFHSDIALSITGIAGPEGGTEEKPVGTFYIGYSDKTGTTSCHFLFPSTREKVRMHAAYCALDVLRRRLLEQPITCPQFVHKFD